MFPIPLPQPLLRDRILPLHPLQRRPDQLERLVRAQVLVVVLVPLGAVVLDLLAGELDLGDAEGGGGAFEEVAEGGEFGEVFDVAEVVMGEGGKGVSKGRVSSWIFTREQVNDGYVMQHLGDRHRHR